MYLQRRYDPDGCQVEVAQHGRVSSYYQCDKKVKHEVEVVSTNYRTGEKIPHTLRCCGIHRSHLERGNEVHMILSLKETPRVHSWNSDFNTARVTGELSDKAKREKAITALQEKLKRNRWAIEAFFRNHGDKIVFKDILDEVLLEGQELFFERDRLTEELERLKGTE